MVSIWIIYGYSMDLVDGFLNWFWDGQWVDFSWESLNWKPARLSHEIWEFPAIFPRNQSIEMGCLRLYHTPWDHGLESTLLSGSFT